MKAFLAVLVVLVLLGAGGAFFFLRGDTADTPRAAKIPLRIKAAENKPADNETFLAQVAGLWTDENGTRIAIDLKAEATTVTPAGKPAHDYRIRSFTVDLTANSITIREYAPGGITQERVLKQEWQEGGFFLTVDGQRYGVAK